MTDTKIIWNPDSGFGDWALVGSQLDSGDDLETAVLISLFTDRIANADDVIPDGTNNPRGWHGDEDIPIGSRLWLLDRAKLPRDTAKRTKDYAVEALQWLIDDGSVIRFSIDTEVAPNGQLRMRIVTYTKNGKPKVLAFAWRGNS